MAKANTLPKYPKGITFEQVWAALMEDREQQIYVPEGFKPAEW